MRFSLILLDRIRSPKTMLKKKQHTTAPPSPLRQQLWQDGSGMEAGLFKVWAVEKCHQVLAAPANKGGT